MTQNSEMPCPMCYGTGYQDDINPSTGNFEKFYRQCPCKRLATPEPSADAGKNILELEAVNYELGYADAIKLTAHDLVKKRETIRSDLKQNTAPVALPEDREKALDWWVNGIHYFKRTENDDSYWLCGNKIFETVKEALQSPLVYDWMPIETAPKDGSYILVWVGDNWNGRLPYVRTCWRGYWENEFGNGSQVSNFNPTHWRAMLPTPKFPNGDK